jgi:hypothetical protein
VPPLYTYFWPGIYSQQTITGCMSPYRFAPLAPPEDVFGQNGASNKQLQARLVPPSADRARTAGGSEGAR